MIYQFPVTGVFTTNAYFWIDNKTGHGILVDPGAQADVLEKVIAQNGWTIEKILLTHGHFDHFGAVKQLHEDLNIPVYIHQRGKAYLSDPNLNLSAYHRVPMVFNEENFFQDGDVFSISTDPENTLHVLSTPGHTLDSCTFYIPKENIALVGDAIFKGQPGDWNYPTGNRGVLLQSIKDTILQLPDETILASGHTEPTTVENEKPLYFPQ